MGIRLHPLRDAERIEAIVTVERLLTRGIDARSTARLHLAMR
ncbi:hypothetical protein AWB69_06247 [Caballeronia udeis]|uniref:Uncharacterized protein n=1 Tax=Caballeronia udeis TaxID=1232866 RepID=A0A158IMS6_9BURK|nr:hypothetical protein AWB69_06247 [Caballeronia udeis]